MHRSRLFVPADDAGALAAGIAGAADGLILDLEDTVAVDRKTVARDQAVDALRQHGRRGLSVRVNPVESRFVIEDLTTLVLGARDVLCEVWLPKVERAADVAHVDWLLRDLEVRAGLPDGHVGLFVLVETATGIEEMGAIGRASSRLRQLAFGIADLSGDLGLRWPANGSEQLYVRSRVAVVSRAAGLARPMDSIWPRLDDDEALRADCLAARTLGFSGKFALSPSQVDVINDVFSPTTDEIRQADQLLKAFADAERSGRAAIQLPGGDFVDYAFLRRAEETMETARRLGLTTD